MIARSRLRSGREHWAQVVAVEVRQRTLDMAVCGKGLIARRYGRMEGRKTSDIKSKNPYLTDGE